jgi:hypothetical protein
MDTPVLNGFAQRTHSRGRYGFDWSIVIGIALQFLQQCMNDRGALQSAAQSGLTRSQKQALCIRCRQSVRGKVPLFRAWEVGNQLADDIEAELKATASGGLMGSDGGADVYQAAIDEAGALLG